MIDLLYCHDTDCDSNCKENARNYGSPSDTRMPRIEPNSLLASETFGELD